MVEAMGKKKIRKAVRQWIATQSLKRITLSVVGCVCTLFVGAALDHFLWPSIMESIDRLVFGESKLIVNFTEFHPLESIDSRQAIDGKFNVVYASKKGKGMIFFIQQGHAGLEDLYNYVAIPTHLGNFPNKVEYSLIMKNIERRSIDTATISFKGHGLEADPEQDIDSRMQYVNCDGFGENECVVHPGKMMKGEERGMYFRTDHPIADMHCDIANCFLNHRRMYFLKVEPEMTVRLSTQGRYLPVIPAVPSTDDVYVFLFQPDQDTWVPLVTPM